MVFISHSSLDSWTGARIAEKVEDLSARTWIDIRDLRGGDVLVGKIIEGIRASEEVIVLVSPYAVNSQWIVFEIGAARGLNKRVTLILNNVDHDAIEPAKDVKAVKLADFDTFLAELKGRITML